MKMHYGFMENYGDYESPMYGCEETICGYDSPDVLEMHTTDNWNYVDCKKCLRLREKVIREQEHNNEIICNQMGEMVDFINKLREVK